MGLRINTNVSSLNAQRNLLNTSRDLSKALERLSSGSRINRAGDDAAGLAISEGLKSQVRGLAQAVRNANDSLGFLSTAEGALSEITNITQRLRELAIQAANGAIGNTERGYLNGESSSLLAEFNRIANQTEFNGTKLLDGTFNNTDLQVGVNKGETIAFTIGDARTSSLGALATRSGAQNLLHSSFSSITLGADATAISISGDDDAVSNAGKGYSAIAVAAAVNAKSGSTGIKADAEETVLQLNDIDSGALGDVGATAAGDFVLNGFNIVGSVATVGDFVKTVNSFSSSTGVEARLKTGSKVDVELYATDGRNIDITLGSATGAASTVKDLYEAFQATTNVQGSTGGFNRLFTAASLASAGLAGTIYTGKINLSASNTIIIGGSQTSNAFGFTDTAIAVDTKTAIFSISIDTQSSAQNALSTIDATLTQLNSLRASLGAVQNRLDSTIRNLSIGQENIASAESQIRDADIASETANLTRAQILQQAGVAVLGQANTNSQVALRLLQF